MAHTWHYGEPEDGILRVRIEREDEPVNSFARESLLELRTLVDSVKGNSDIKGVIFRSGKQGNFVAGADINELRELNEREAAREIAKLGQEVFQALEDLTAITVALISGSCVGGGLEFVMSCDYRIADDSTKTVLGLPEVKLGLIPGWGGTVRMVRHCGLITALPLILTGKFINGKSAKSKGLIHDCVPNEAFDYVGDKIVGDIAASKDKSGTAKKLFRPRKKPWLKTKIMNSGFIEKLALKKAEKQVLENTHGHYPAPLKIIQVLRENRETGPKGGFLNEADAIAELSESPVTTECMRLFFLQEGAKKAPDWLKAEVNPKSISKAAVLGAGAMGGGIALLLAKKGIWTRLKDIKPEFLTVGMQEIRKLLKKDTKRRKLTKLQAEQAMDHLSPTLDYHGLQNADIVIEAIVENVEIKRAVFDELAAATSPTTVLATNTSSLRVADICRDVAHPERVVGLHFFNPPHRMPLIEIIRHENSSDEAVAAALALTNRLGKTGVVVGDCAGFLVNRLLSPYMNEAGFLLLEVNNPLDIEKAAVDFGMPMGPLELSDLVGLQVAAHVARNMHEAYGERMAPAPLWGRMQRESEGKKDIKLILKSKKSAKSVNPAVAKFVSTMKSENRQVGSVPSKETIIERLVFPIINEAAICLAEGVVDSADDIDIAMVFGTGFAPFRGGPMRYAESVGLSHVVAKLEEFAKTNPRMAPSDALKRFASGQKNFSSIAPAQDTAVA